MRNPGAPVLRPAIWDQQGWIHICASRAPVVCGKCDGELAQHHCLLPRWAHNSCKANPYLIAECCMLSRATLTLKSIHTFHAVQGS